MTYEYVCQACGHQWEAEQSIKDRPLENCVSCGANKAKRLVSGGTGFLLKGGGWYADLYGSPGSGAGKGSDDKGSKSGASSSKSDSASTASGSSDAGSSGDTKTSSGDSKAAASSASTPSSSSSGSTPAPSAKAS